jgi:hypothetical protein
MVLRFVVDVHTTCFGLHGHLQVCEHPQQNARPSTIKLHEDGNLPKKLLDSPMSGYSIGIKIGLHRFYIWK